MLPITPQNYDDYLDFTLAKIEDNRGISGYKSRLAAAAGCHPSYLSQVLNGKVHLTTDQAFGLQLFWELPLGEGQYFLNLVEIARSANQQRIQFLKRQNSELLEELHSIASNLGKEEEASKTPDWALYYSSWHYSAIHMAATIKQYNTPIAIANYLSLSESKVEEALLQLQEMGMVAKSAKTGKWFATVQDQFVSKESIDNRHHQKNLRTRLIASPDKDKMNIHYGGIYSIDPKTAMKIESLLRESILKLRELGKTADSECLYGVHVDLYEF